MSDCTSSAARHDSPEPEYVDSDLRAGLLAAQHFRANFHHGFMANEDVEPNADLIRRFVNRMLMLAE